MALSKGDRLGPCEILARVGVGGMGEVSKARDARLDRMVPVRSSTISTFSGLRKKLARSRLLITPDICQLTVRRRPDYLVLFVEGSRRGAFSIPGACVREAQPAREEGDLWAAG